MIDRFICEFDKALRTVFAPAPTLRAVPGAELTEAEMDAAQRRHTAALMRVNHCGEICAQALYQGQSLTSRDTSIKTALQRAAQEETEHLAWTERRIAELGGRKSLLNPLWYAGALAIGEWPASLATPGIWDFSPRPRSRSKRTSKTTRRACLRRIAVPGKFSNRCASTKKAMPAPPSVSAHGNCRQR